MLIRRLYTMIRGLVNDTAINMYVIHFTGELFIRDTVMFTDNNQRIGRYQLRL